MAESSRLKPRPRPGVRVAYLFAYASFAALGEGLLARPAALWLRGLGLFHPALPWLVPSGQTACLLGFTLAVFTLRLSIGFALGEKIRVSEHALFLLLVAFALVVRVTAPAPQPPRDPGPALLDGLRLAGAELDKAYKETYPVDIRSIDSALAALPRPGFVYRGRELPLRLERVPAQGGATPGPALSAGELPGQILAVGLGTNRVWLTATTLRAGAPALLELSGRPVVLEAHAGTHSVPGRDPLVPAYPGMRLLSDTPSAKRR